jgi:ectoine hydroxylase-related dioxygenase (phytanoyl-CoA dioxygenase family)
LNFDESGFEVIHDILTKDEVQHLLQALETQQLTALRGGIRRIEQLLSEVELLAKSEKILALAQNYLSAPAQFVRAIYFDKNPENNWLVSWHQDRTVSVSDRFEKSGWGPWSRKADAWHVQPPIEVLENMITIRLNLDASSRSNGCLKFILGSHRDGIIKTAQVAAHLHDKTAVYCAAPAGSAVLMRPHIFHASEKASSPASRRVLHFEYTSHVLPEGIAWSA